MEPLRHPSELLASLGQELELYVWGQRKSCPISCFQEMRKKSHFTILTVFLLLFFSLYHVFVLREEILKRFCCLSFSPFLSFPFTPLHLFFIVKVAAAYFLLLKNKNKTNIFNNINNTWISLSYKVKISQVKVNSFSITILNPSLLLSSQM